MRATVRRIDTWSAAKVGALVGIIGGLALGVVFVSLSAALAPLFPYIGEGASLPAWPAVLLLGVFGGSATAVLFAVGALVYNLISRLGAAFVIELDPTNADGKPPGRDPMPSESAHEVFHAPSFTDPQFGE